MAMCKRWRFNVFNTLQIDQGAHHARLASRSGHALDFQFNFLNAY